MSGGWPDRPLAYLRCSATDFREATILDPKNSGQKKQKCCSQIRFAMQKNVTAAESQPWTLLGELTAFPRTLLGELTAFLQTP